jgi:hypothetical protein
MSFDSYGVAGIFAGPIHGQITLDATKRLGIEHCDELQDAVRFPDWEQTSVTRLQLRPNDLYKASNHFDRSSEKTSEQAFKEAAFFVRTEREKAIAFAKMGNSDAALASLGRVLHAIQDLVSHSNLIDLEASKQAEVTLSIWDETKPTPSELKITGYDPKSPTPGEPPGDNYGHDKYSKDNAKKNAEAKMMLNGVSKHKVAYNFAVDLSEKTILSVKTELGTQWESFSKAFQ